MRNEPNLSPANSQKPKAKSQQPNMRNEPNSRTPSVPPPPIYAKRTQFPPGQHPKAKSQKLLLQNEPNLHHAHPASHQKNETNPIYPHAPLFTIHCSLLTILRKRTQFPTNNIHSTIDNIQSLGPIPTAGDLWRTKKAKQTQFTPPSTIHNIQYTIPGWFFVDKSVAAGAK